MTDVAGPCPGPRLDQRPGPGRRLPLRDLRAGRAARARRLGPQPRATVASRPSSRGRPPRSRRRSPGAGAGRPAPGSRTCAAEPETAIGETGFRAAPVELRRRRAVIATRRPIMPGAEPFEYPGRPDVGVLLVHGFTGSPFEMRPVGEALASSGIGSIGVLLRGHGTHPDDMVGYRYTDWIADVESALDRLLERHERAVIVGLSMGGTLTLNVAARRANDPRVVGLVTIGATLYLTGLAPSPRQPDRQGRQVAGLGPAGHQGSARLGPARRLPPLPDSCPPRAARPDARDERAPLRGPPADPDRPRPRRSRRPARQRRPDP